MHGSDMKEITLVNENPSEGIVAASRGDAPFIEVETLGVL
jgi:hypothetical protein